MFPGEVEASVGDFPVALYLGPSLVSAARFTELGEPLLIAKVDANQAWKDYTTARATLEHSLQSENQDAHLITTFLPRLEQIVKAVTDKLDDFVIGSLLLPPSCQSQSGTIWELISNNSNPDSPQYRQISLPPIKEYGYYGPSRFLPRVVLLPSPTTSPLLANRMINSSIHLYGRSVRQKIFQTVIRLSCCILTSSVVSYSSAFLH